jgi:hypothetical protein
VWAGCPDTVGLVQRLRGGDQADLVGRGLDDDLHVPGSVAAARSVLLDDEDLDL